MVSNTFDFKLVVFKNILKLGHVTWPRPI